MHCFEQIRIERKKSLGREPLGIAVRNGGVVRFSGRRDVLNQLAALAASVQE
jgi:hypothetical protein